MKEQFFCERCLSDLCRFMCLDEDDKCPNCDLLCTTYMREKLTAEEAVKYLQEEKERLKDNIQADMEDIKYSTGEIDKISAALYKYWNG